MIYLDTNKLFGWAMSQPLPIHGFQWMSKEEPCILEVDLPENIHHHHNDYPLAPEIIMVGKVDKLVPNLRKKKDKKHM